MREIKFRAYGLLRTSVKNGQDNYRMFYPKKAEGLEEFLRRVREECISWELQQFTGLKDKNGKDIYEGDIVKGIGRTGTILVAEIVFRPDYGWSGEWRYFKPKEGERKDVFCIGSIACHNYHKEGWKFEAEEDIEVIGNKFENPGLFK